MNTIKDLHLKPLEAVRKLSPEKLKEEVQLSQKALYTLNMKLVTGEQKQTHVIKVLRRYIASLKTIHTQTQS